MIPKVIHYCWFGRGPMPQLAQKCIESWRKYLPGYEIKEWNEDNFDVNIIPYTQEAYEAKKYAFVSDYARFWILYNHGGLYFDTDVEIIKPIDKIITQGPFMGCENESKLGAVPLDLGVAPGLGLGCNSGLSFYKEMLDFYATLSFYKADGTYNLQTIVSYTTNQLCKHGLKNTNHIQECAGILIYPRDYFSPLSYKDGKLYMTERTITIHHYAGSWVAPKEKLKRRVINLLGEKIVTNLLKVKKMVLKR